MIIGVGLMGLVVAAYPCIEYRTRNGTNDRKLLSPSQSYPFFNPHNRTPPHRARLILGCWAGVNEITGIRRHRAGGEYLECRVRRAWESDWVG